MAEMTQFNRMQTIKRRFFAMRNGVIADRLRKAGSGFRIIFGLNVPQISEIASEIGHDAELGRELWRNKSTRESMLLATMLLRPGDLPEDELQRMCSEVNDIELADMLCHKILRHTADPCALARSLSESDSPMLRYIALRLMYGQARNHPQLAREIAVAELGRVEKLSALTARMLVEEADFWIEEGR